MTSPKILVLFAHPAIHKSKVNRALAQEAVEINGITFHDLYENYPDFVIDVKKEQTLLESHDIFVFQHPFYWYSTPAIVKEWLDLVLEYGWAYGPGGEKLEGKKWVHAISTGGPEDAYTAKGYNRYTIRELLAPLEQSANLCGTEFLDPFVIHQALRYKTETDLGELRKKYRAFLEGLRAT